MIKKVFIFLIIVGIIGGVFYQKKYIAGLKNQSKIIQNNQKPIVAEGFGFQNFSYNQTGSLKASLSSQKIIYYQDSSFSLEGDVKYQEYNLKLEPVTTIQTEFGFGKFEQYGNQDVFSFSASRRLIWLQLPGGISFNLNGNQGTAKNVFIDAVKRTIYSTEHIRSSGPDGNISADGFFYDIDNKEFTLNSSVRGTYKPPKQERK